MQHAYNPQNDIDTGQSIKCTAFARKTWPKKIGVSGFSYMVRRYPVKAVKTGNWCLTVCQGVQTLSTDIFVLKSKLVNHCKLGLTDRGTIVHVVAVVHINSSIAVMDHPKSG